MSELKDSSVKPLKPKDKKQSVVKKLDPNTAKLLTSIKERTNKKAFGRKVRDAEIIAAGLGLIGEDHIKDLQTQTYTEKDHLNIAHADFVKAHGKISLDQFIGKLLRSEIQLPK